LETPTNPLLHVIDIAAVARTCATHKVLLAVDNTFATPYLQNPIELGADIVMHSTTKYIGGHSDALGGFVAVDRLELHDVLKFHQNAVGGVPGPFDCFLTLRGAKTLAIRMREHERNARAVADFLHAHREVERVYYPGLESHPQHRLAAVQMRGFGGIVSFTLKGPPDRARVFATKTRLFSLAESLGGVESLITHPAAMTHGSIPKEVREARGVTDGLLRLSVGIEAESDLIADLEDAMAASAVQVKTAPAS
ncbi:MAG: PLP-dependent transferase, partial [Candidatus Eremiobacteraeota bacterium]|nr:PLP-dependent transferase [Candidatus Eremiobacteraeota bacterium]